MQPSVHRYVCFGGGGVLHVDTLAFNESSIAY
jgi:hypothetical protein